MSSGLLYATPNTGFQLLPASSLSLLVCVHLILVCSLQVPAWQGPWVLLSCTLHPLQSLPQLKGTQYVPVNGLIHVVMVRPTPW